MTQDLCPPGIAHAVDFLGARSSMEGFRSFDMSIKSHEKDQTPLPKRMSVVTGKPAPLSLDEAKAIADEFLKDVKRLLPSNAFMAFMSGASLDHLEKELMEAFAI